LRLTGLLLGPSFIFYIVTSVWLNSALNRSGTPPSEGTLRFSAWAFDWSVSGSSVIARAAYAPLGVWIAVIVAMLATSRIAVAPKMRVGNNFGQAGRMNRMAIANFRGQCRQRGFAGLQNPYRIKMKIGFGVTAMLALVATATGHLVGGTHQPGVGMFVALFVGLAGALAFCMLWPSRDAMSFAVDENGNVWPVAMTPLAESLVPPTTAAPVAPQVWAPPAAPAPPAPPAPLAPGAITPVAPVQAAVATETSPRYEARFCADCGHQRDPGDHFCPGCGHTLTEFEHGPETEECR
jgi:hypothetical protein